MSPENVHKLRIYMGGLILGVNTLYMLSCFLKQFALLGKGLTGIHLEVSVEAYTSSFGYACPPTGL